VALKKLSNLISNKVHFRCESENWKRKKKKQGSSFEYQEGRERKESEENYSVVKEKRGKACYERIITNFFFLFDCAQCSFRRRRRRLKEREKLTIFVSIDVQVSI
jgi:hypothetical protein